MTSASGDVESLPLTAVRVPTRLCAVRWLLLLGTLLCAIGLTTIYVQVVGTGGINLAEFLALAIFIVLAFWISFSFCTCVLGFWVSVLSRNRPSPSTSSEQLPPTAILVPVYNESPMMVFSGILAMARSLERTGRYPNFEFFVLSDTQKDDIAIQEEQAWREASARMPAGIPLFYRRRTKNEGRKAGNIADFVRRWGGRYELMIVLDADSVMEGATLVEMTARAAADKSIGILQVPPKPVNRHSLLARMQQFAAEVYGPVHLSGYRAWTGREGNYFGHNAVIRTELFARYCTLPVLPGEPPLGGHILSHDFVEAALIRRAGYHVETADDLDGSYEECPTTLLDYAIRDQRWCQGNLQHGRLIAFRGWPLVSRIHFLTGVLSYVSSVLWLSFIIASVTGAYLDRDIAGEESIASAFGLFGIVMGMLLAPKAMALVLLSLDRKKSSRLGGWSKVAAGVVLETVLTVLLAPLLAIYHATFVLSTLIWGRSVQWNAQSRDERVIPWQDLIRLHGWQTAIGVLLLFGSFWLSPETGAWSLPFTAGLCLAVPIAFTMGSRPIGERLKDYGLLIVREEIVRPAILIERDTACDDLSRALKQRRYFHSGAPGNRRTSTQSRALFTSTFSTNDS